MRLLFFVFLLVNVMAFAYYAYREQGGEPKKPALPELNAERIRLVGVEQANKKNDSSEKLTCWSWSGLNPGSMDQARIALGNLALGGKLTQPIKEEFWVYIPPLKNKQDAAKKMAELKALTITEGVAMEDHGKWRLAISIAAYPTEEAATVRLNQLKEKGVKTAKILKRDVVGDTFVIQQADEKTVSALSKLQAQFAETALKQVECKTP